MTDKSTLRTAWKNFQRGDIPSAKKTSVDLVRSRACEIKDTPYINSLLIEGLHASLLKNDHAAFSSFYGVLKIERKNHYALGLMHALLDSIEPKSKNNPGSSETFRIFGLGTGRSGSSSLAKFLSQIANSYASHEHAPIVEWENGENLIEWHLQRMFKLSKRFDYVIDVSHWWLPYVERIIEIDSNAYFICSRRSKAETIKSFLKIKGGGHRGSINHWSNHDGSYFKRNSWDICYPKYSCEKLSDCLSLYWEEYYKEAARLEASYPDRFLICDLSDFSSESGVKRISNFLPIANLLRPYKNILNKGTISDGVNMVQNPFF